jgi:hypothetical protein
MFHFKKKALLLIPLFILFLGLPVDGEQMPSKPDNQKQVVKLTKKQQAELTTLHKDILDKKKQLISKYVEYGVMPKEKGDKIISRLEDRYTKLKENGSVPKWDKMHKHHHHDE